MATEVRFPGYADPLMHRLATETLRLQVHHDLISHKIAQNRAELRSGLAARHLTHLHLDGLTIRRNGPRDITILTTSR